MGAGARARYGLRFRRFLHHGLCLPGRAQIQAHDFMATAARVLEPAVDDCRNSYADGGAPLIAAILISRGRCLHFSVGCGNRFLRSDGPNYSAIRQA